MSIDSMTGKKNCFVIMPISDVEGYDPGHFGRIYEHLIKPACEAAGINPIRADEVQITNYIVIDILRQVLEADIVICDLSSRNPNVMYELGVRQAFNLPVTLIKDARTSSIFDIQGLRYIEYDENLRVDRTNAAIKSIAATLKNNLELKVGDVNSVVQLLGKTPRIDPTFFEQIQETVKASLLSSDLINKLVATISQASGSQAENEVGKILDSAVDSTVEKIRESGFITFDSTVLLHDKGMIWQEQFIGSQSINRFLDVLWYRLTPHIPAHTYGEKWILRDQESGHVFHELSKFWAEENNVNRDKRTIYEAGVRPGMTLQIVAVKKPEEPPTYFSKF